MVVFSEGGESRPVSEGLFIVGGYNEGYFFSTWVAAQLANWSSSFIGGFIISQCDM
jgi:hypothetical protein